jgi:Concanavalin A-like lectin/glucanases superfamily
MPVRFKQDSNYVPGVNRARFPITGTGAIRNVGSFQSIFDPNVSLLLHGDGDNNSTAFVDSTIYSNTFTRYGGTVISTAQSKFNGSSIYFQASSQSGLVATPGSHLSFGTGNFTVECWLYLDSYGSTFGGPASSYWASFYDSAVSHLELYRYNGFMGLISNVGTIGLYSSGGIFLSSSASLSLSTWQHVALVRSSGTVNIYIDGINRGSASFSTNLSLDGCVIGSPRDRLPPANNNNEQIKLNGYVDEFRIKKGVAEYTTNFTPPTLRFPDAI